MKSASSKSAGASAQAGQLPFATGSKHRAERQRRALVEWWQRAFPCSPNMLNISSNLSAAVRASVSLAPSDRLLFVAKHLKAQADGAQLPEAVPSGAPPVSRPARAEGKKNFGQNVTNANRDGITGGGPG